ncbi:PAS domain S-box-containing protein [Methanomicrobium sp. W14]|uniref:PAS domain-containing protein n=1 Tax=Methanomicrobium sp. W14 TaxID=2817839 RepID=UPI001AE474ED|nr:PAS domain-containing protein [Methanomicrobium sp. W14]MBP2133536.1 PAS domain S-box-containing protein [Methanomicrobium sp. W14]
MTEDDKIPFKDSLEEIRRRIIGFGEDTLKKSYYPMLQYKEDELKRFRTALDSTSDLVFILDYPSFNIIDANGRAERALGYTKSEFLNKNIGHLTGEKTAKYISNMLLNFKKQSGFLNADIFKKNGECIKTEINISLAGLGEDTFAAAVCRDLTERKILEDAVKESELQYRMTINSLNDIIIVADENLDIVIFNEAFDTFCRKTETGSAENAKNLKNIRKYFFYEGYVDLENASAYTEFFEINLKYKHGGDVAIYSARNLPIFESGKFRQSVLYLRDMTEYHLMDKIKKDAFMQIDKNMEQFAILNDHIRNPLQVILGIVDLECPEVAGKILPHIKEIDSIINRLDNGWVESEKVRKMIAKHYKVSIIDRSDIGEAVNYLIKNPEQKCR